MKSMLLVALLCAVGLVGCSSTQNPVQSGQGDIKMYLVDRAIGLDAVNIVVTEVSVHQAGADIVAGWTVIENTTRTFNLLTPTNGASTLLGSQKLNAGHYTQLRLKIGAGSTVGMGNPTRWRCPVGRRPGSSSIMSLQCSTPAPFSPARGKKGEYTVGDDSSRPETQASWSPSQERGRG